MERTTPLARNDHRKLPEKIPLRHSSLKDAAPAYGRYRATTLWNNIIRHFREEMPLKRHRRQLTYFEESFTGKEAVDFLMDLLPRLIFEGRQVDRSNCVTLLQKFLDQGIIERTRANANEKPLFKDNAAIYVFSNDCDRFGITHTPRIIRSNSYAENHAGSMDIPSSLESELKRRSPDPMHHLRIRTPVENKLLNRRMSSSHGNLMLLVSQNKPLQSSSQDFDSADSLAETIDSERVVVNFNLRPSPVREYNTPVAANLHKNEGRRKVSLTEKKKSPRPDKSPSKHTTKVDETEKESHYEWLSFVRKKKPLAEQNKPPRCPSKSRDPKIRSGKSGEAVELIEHRKRIDGEVEKSQTTDPIYCPIKVTHRFVTEIDLWSIWKSCLLARLSRILSLTTLPFITWTVDGQDIKWNCQRVGSSGVVKARSDRVASEEFSGYVLKLMRYLEQFPFPSGSANIITYKDNQEVNVFRTVCSHLAREPPMLKSDEASALIQVISIFDEKLVCDAADPYQSCGRDVFVETEFTGNIPRSRMVSRPHSRSIPHYVSTSSAHSSRSSVAENFDLVRRDEMAYRDRTSPKFPNSRTDVGHSAAFVPPSSLAGNERSNTYILKGLPEYEEIINLPGLKKSPELMKRLDDLCLKPKSRCEMTNQISSDSIKLPEFNELQHDERRCATSRNSQVLLYGNIGSSETVSSLDEECSLKPSDSLLEALSLVLLTLPPARRRRLHYLIRFMNKIAANHCLQLDELQSNKDAVVKGLSRSIVSLRESTKITSLQRTKLITLLLDHERKVFAVPMGLVSDVEAAVHERQREKLMPSEQCDGSVAKQATSVQFCDQIQKCEYEKQNMQLHENLLELLEQICCDENLSQVEKRRRLKKFKKTYPAVYSQRFPSPDVAQSKRKERDYGLFSKLFGR
ncbi:hypothetical protein Q1695_012506 [Nippostrongylus brasiliensis]|nr:hypothetical protein Q1695_012506 [Nippostrongylus brasiliensis]